MKINKTAFAAVSMFLLSAGCGAAFASGTAMEQLSQAATNTPAAYEDVVVRGGSMAALTAGPAAETTSVTAAQKPALARSIKGVVPAPEAQQKSSEGAVIGGAAGFMSGFLLVLSPAAALGLVPIVGDLLAPIASAVLFIPAVVVGIITGTAGAIIGGIVS